MLIHPKIKEFCNKKVAKLFSENYWQKLQKKIKGNKGNKDELFTDRDARTKYQICWCDLI